MISFFDHDIYLDIFCFEKNTFNPAVVYVCCFKIISIFDYIIFVDTYSVIHPPPPQKYIYQKIMVLT